MLLHIYNTYSHKTSILFDPRNITSTKDLKRSPLSTHVHVTCFFGEPLGLGLREWGNLIAFSVWTSMLKAMEVHALAVNHQVWQLSGQFGLGFLQKGRMK